MAENESPYNELQNNDSLMISFDPTFNEDDDQMKHVPHYQDFARDVLSALKQHRSIQGCVELLLACISFVTIYSIILTSAWWWSVGACLVFLALYCAIRTYLHTALCDALFSRIDEWKAYVYDNSEYTLEWVPPEDWWNIYPGVQFTPKSSSSKKNVAPTAPPATTKYYAKIARFIPPRDVTARTIQDSTARPPALANDEDAEIPFGKFLAAAKAQLEHDQGHQLKRMGGVMLLSLIVLWLVTEDADIVVRGLFLTLVFFDIFDDCILQHVLDKTSVETLYQDDDEKAYEIKYGSERPLFGLRETFFTIVRKDNALV